MPKISELPLAGPLTGAEALPVVQGGNTRRANIVDFLQGAVGAAIDEAVAQVGTGVMTSGAFTMNSERLLGRTSPSSGRVEEISIGAGLSLSAGVLTAQPAGVLPIANGGTNATTAAAARTNLGAAAAGAIGGSGLTMTTARILGRTTASTGVVEEITIGAGLTLTAGVLSATGGGSGSGTVTSVQASGGTTGLNFSGGPIVSAGTLTLGGTLAVAHGGTGVTTSTGTGSVVLSASPTFSGSPRFTGDIVGVAGNTGALGIYGGSAFNAGAGIVLHGSSHPLLPNIIQFTGNGFVERMRIDANGNVGIATASPSARLHVREDLNGTSGVLIHNRFNAGGEPVAALRFITGGLDLSDNRFSAITSQGAAASDLRFITSSGGPVERMRIASDGNLGIGTSDPQSRLHVVSGGSSQLGIQVRQPSTNQFAAAGLLCRGPVGSGLQGASGFYHFSQNTGGTAGAMAIAQYDENGAFQRTLCEYDYTLQRWAFYTNAQARLSIDNNGDITSSDRAAGIGYKGLPTSLQGGGYVLVLGDMGRQISITGGITIPANAAVAFPDGTTIVIYNNTAVAQNIAINSDTLRLAGTGTTGTRSLAQRGLCTLVKVAATEWVATGNVT